MLTGLLSQLRSLIMENVSVYKLWIRYWWLALTLNILELHEHFTRRETYQSLVKSVENTSVLVWEIESRLPPYGLGALLVFRYPHLKNCFPFRFHFIYPLFSTYQYPHVQAMKVKWLVLACISYVEVVYKKKLLN